MKKLLFLFMLPVFFACSTPETQTTLVSLQLENISFEEARLQYLTDFIARNSFDLTVAVEAEGPIVFTLEPARPVMAIITLGSRRVSVYLEPGKDLTLLADMQDPDNTFVFEGSLAAENKFLTAYNKEVAPRFNQQQTMAKYREAGPEEFAHYAGQMFIEGTAFVDDFHRQQPLSETFLSYFHTDISYQVYRNLLNYPAYHAWFTGLEEQPEMPDDYFDFLLDATAFDDKNLAVPSYAAFTGELHRFLQAKHKDLIPEGFNSMEQKMWIADEYFHGKTRDFVKATLITFELNHGEYASGKQAYENFLAESTSQEYKDILTGVHTKASRIAPGQAAPVFSLTGIDGEEVSLTDFRGKVVYLDFWASWCGPCMREVPFAKELKKRFDGEKDLVFLYVSVDEDEAAWRRTVDQQGIQGVHLNIKGMRDDIAQLYNVQGVPSFFIIDRNGNIHNNNPSRPSGETIDQELREVLEM